MYLLDTRSLNNALKIFNFDQTNQVRITRNTYLDGLLICKPTKCLPNRRYTDATFETSTETTETPDLECNNEENNQSYKNDLHIPVASKAKTVSKKKNLVPFGIKGRKRLASVNN